MTLPEPGVSLHVRFEKKARRRSSSMQQAPGDKPCCSRFMTSSKDISIGYQFGPSSLRKLFSASEDAPVAPQISTALVTEKSKSAPQFTAVTNLSRRERSPLARNLSANVSRYIAIPRTVASNVSCPSAAITGLSNECSLHYNSDFILPGTCWPGAGAPLLAAFVRSGREL